MYICKKCGRTCDSLEERGWMGCECGGDFVEAVKCRICGYYYPENSDELYEYNLCKYCLEDEAETKGYEYGLKIGEDNKTDVYINGLVATLLTPEEINKILLDYVEANKDKIHNLNEKSERYCLEDIGCFAQYVEE